MSTFDLVGPFQHHAVVINGWRVPFLEATPLNGGRIDLTLDSRYSVEVTVEEAERVLPFIADCIAVALGYTAHPRPHEGLPEPRPRCPIQKMTAL